jgi:hypothetical protein
MKRLVFLLLAALPLLTMAQSQPPAHRSAADSLARRIDSLIVIIPENLPFIAKQDLDSCFRQLYRTMPAEQYDRAIPLVSQFVNMVTRLAATKIQVGPPPAAEKPKEKAPPGRRR